MVLVVRYPVLLGVVSSVKSSSGPKGKKNSLQLSFQKDLLPLSFSESYSNIPFLWDHTPFPFWPHEDSTDETTPRSTGYQTSKTIRNEEDFTIHYDNGKLQLLKTLKTSRVWRLWRIPRFVWPRNATLMELGKLWKLSMPEIKVYQ